MDKKTKTNREFYNYFLDVPTRWMDNDVYGHVNNVVYYSYFDTVVNKFLVEKGLLDYRNGDVIGLVVETKCEFFSPISFPSSVTAGLKALKVGRTSVKYGIGIFCGEEYATSAEGYFVHVYVDKDTYRPKPITVEMKDILAQII